MARSFLDSPRFFYGWSVVAIAFVTMGVGVNARTAFSLLFPPILDEFGWPRGVTAGAFSFGFLVSGVLGPILGRVMDRRSPRVVMLLGVALAGAGLGLAPLITAPWNLYMTLGVLVGGGTVCLGYTGHALFLLLLAMRHQPTPVLLYSMVVAQGVFGYGLASVLGAIPAELFQGKQYGTIFGTLSLASIVGGAIGPWVAGVLHDRTGSDVLALWLGRRDVARGAAQGAGGCGARPSPFIRGNHMATVTARPLSGPAARLGSGRYLTISSSSISKTSVAPGLMTGGRP